MRLLLCCVTLFLVPLVQCEGDVDIIVRVLQALTKALHFFSTKVDEINVDSVYCIRQVQEQLDAYLTHVESHFRTFRHWIEVLRDKAQSIADQGRDQLLRTAPPGLDNLKFWMDVSPRKPWYPTRNTSDQFVESRVLCKDTKDLNGTQSDMCFHELRPSDKERCRITPDCIEMVTKHNQLDYFLTHQALYWRHSELQGCVEEAPEELRQRLCANVMRDAKVIAAAGVPQSHQDLFMESIGVCGFWGYGDFNKPEWTERILELQTPSGCFKHDAHIPARRYYCTDDLKPDPPSRVKRTELILSDNCMTHKTAVALLAWLSILRFEAENVFQNMDPTQNALNKMLV